MFRSFLKKHNFYYKQNIKMMNTNLKPRWICLEAFQKHNCYYERMSFHVIMTTTAVCKSA